ncbi:MAG: hypothetical protein RLZZ350_972 [Verrucomicrobiota bacterium]|jgi:hypothetical protein
MKTKVHAVLFALAVADFVARAEDAALANTLHGSNAVAAVKTKTEQRREFINEWRATRSGQTNPPPRAVIQPANPKLTIEQRREALKKQMQHYRDRRATDPLQVSPQLPATTNTQPVQP